MPRDRRQDEIAEILGLAGPHPIDVSQGLATDGFQSRQFPQGRIVEDHVGWDPALASNAQTKCPQSLEEVAIHAIP